MTAVFRREMGAYFHGVTGYLFMAFVLVFAGIYTMVYNLSGLYANFEYVLDAISFIYLIAVPVLTMRSVAEEKRQRTDQLLYSLPIRLVDVVAGKYLAMLAVLAAPTAVMGLYPLLLSRFGSVYLPTAYASLLAFFLLGLRCWPLVCSFLRFRRARWAAPWFAWPPCCSYFFCPRWPAMCLPRQAHRSSR